MKILLNSDPAPGGGGTSPTSIPAVTLGSPAPASGAQPLTAARALGLSSSPTDDLGRLTQNLASRQPKSTPYAPLPPGVATDKDPDPAPEPAAAAPAPAAEPAAPAAPAAAAPAVASTATTPSAEPKKIKVGDKEYTEAELAEFIATRNAPAPTAPQPAQPVQPAQPQLTPEQVAAQERAQEIQFIQRHAEDFDGYLGDLNEKTLETILGGGPEGAKALRQLFKQVGAASLAQSRKHVHRDFLTPALEDFQRIATQTQELYTHTQQQIAAQAEQRFISKYPDYAPQIDLLRRAAAAVSGQFPNEWAAMTDDQRQQEAIRQVDLHLNKQFSDALGIPVSDWKAVRKQLQPASASAATPAPTPAPVSTPAPVAPAATAAPAPATSRAPVPAPPLVAHLVQQGGAPSTPPTAFAPGASTVNTSAPRNSFHTDVNASIRSH